jgi:hypothetical protein
MANALDRIGMAGPTTFVGNAKVARIEESNERRILVIEDNRGVARIRATYPEFRVAWQHMRLILGQSAA